MADAYVGVEHAWSMLDGRKLVNPMTFDHYHGVVIESDETLRRYYDEDERGAYGAIGNHRDRFAFLRERGYVELQPARRRSLSPSLTGSN